MDLGVLRGQIQMVCYVTLRSSQEMMMGWSQHRTLRTKVLRGLVSQLHLHAHTNITQIVFSCGMPLGN